MFHYSLHHFEIGHVIPAGIWGIRIYRGDGISELIVERELLWERVRVAQFPNRVSRLACVYVYDKLETAIQVRRALVDGEAVIPAVYEVAPANEQVSIFRRCASGGEL